MLQFCLLFASRSSLWYFGGFHGGSAIVTIQPTFGKTTGTIPEVSEDAAEILDMLGIQIFLVIPCTVNPHVVWDIPSRSQFSAGW